MKNELKIGLIVADDMEYAAYEELVYKTAKEIVVSTDWNNSALMHKGLSWMARNYLLQKNMM